jgi:hypothetical protein
MADGFCLSSSRINGVWKTEKFVSLKGRLLRGFFVKEDQMQYLRRFFLDLKAGVRDLRC